MIYRTLYDGKRIPALGAGTWHLGGSWDASHHEDEVVITALSHALDIGYTHIDTAEMYGAGHTEELVSQAIKGWDRSNLFITSKVWKTNLKYQDTLKAVEGSLHRLGTDYLDLYLIHWPNEEIPLAETFDALNKVVTEGKVRYLGVSNFNVNQIKQAQLFSDTPIVTNQVPYRLNHRDYKQNGVYDYCAEHNIIFTAYTPLGKGSIPTDPALGEIAEAHSASKFQIALAWLFNQSNVITIPMSRNPVHISQNLAALDIVLSPEEMTILEGLA